MTTLSEAAKQALDALESLFNWQVDHERGKRCGDAVVALRAALERPVAQYSDIVSDGGMDPRNKYDTTTPQRKPLTIKEINAMPEAQGRWPIGMNDRIVRLIRAVEAAHGIKETP